MLAGLSKTLLVNMCDVVMIVCNLWKKVTYRLCTLVIFEIKLVSYIYTYKGFYLFLIKGVIRCPLAISDRRAVCVLVLATGMHRINGLDIFIMHVHISVSEGMDNFHFHCRFPIPWQQKTIRLYFASGDILLLALSRCVLLVNTTTEKQRVRIS